MRTHGSPRASRGPACRPTGSASSRPSPRRTAQTAGRHAAPPRRSPDVSRLGTLGAPPLQRRGLLRLRRQAPPLVRRLRRHPRARARRPVRPRPQPRHRVQGRLGVHRPDTTATVEEARASVGGRRRRGPDRHAGRRATSIRIQTPALTPTESAEGHRSSSPKDLGVPQADIGVQLVGPTLGRGDHQAARPGPRRLPVLVVCSCRSTSSGGWRSRRSSRCVHDLVITIGIYALTGFEVTPATVIGVLTILGFSLYDTVVVFDKVRENTRRHHVGQPRDLQRGGEPRAQPDPGALDQHLDRGAAARRGDPRRRRRPARCGHAQGPRRSRCSSAPRPAPTRRSSSRRRWPASCRSAARR